MSAPGVSRIPPLRCAGALVLCAVAGAGVQMLIQPSATLLAEAGSSAPSSGNTAARAAMPTRESLAALSPEEQIATLAAALPQMELADILPLVEHLLKARRVAPYGDSLPDLISPLLRALFTRWAALDAAGLSAYVESGPLRYDYDARRLAVLAMVEVRGLSALEEMRAKSPSLAREAAREMLIRQPVQLEALLPFLKGGHPGNANDEMIEIIGDSEAQIAQALGPARYLLFALEMGRLPEDALRVLAEVNSDLYGKPEGEQVLKSIKSLPPGPRRDGVLSTWLLSSVPQWEGLADKEDDYTFFRREYEAMAEGPAKSALNSRYATLRALENPDAALKWAHTLPDARQRYEAVTTICASLFIGTDAGNTFLGFYGREGDAAERLTRQFADAWMAAPEVAAKETHIYDLYPFREWQIKDPAASEAWLATVTNAELRKTLMSRVTLAPHTRWELLPDMASRLDYAADYYYGPPAKGAKLEKEFALVPEWREAARLHQLEKNLPGTAEWETLTPDDRRALSAAAIRLQASGPTEYDPLQPSATGEAAEPPFLQTFNSLPPGERSLGAYYETGAAYIKSDEAAASQWMESLPPGAERDAAATALVEHLVKPGDSQDGEAAFAWAAAMSGEPERTRYTAEAARAWAAEDPAAARTAVEASALPAAQKSALLQQLPAQGGAR